MGFATHTIAEIVILNVPAKTYHTYINQSHSFGMWEFKWCIKDSCNEQIKNHAQLPINVE